MEQSELGLPVCRLVNPSLSESAGAPEIGGATTLRTAKAKGELGHRSRMIPTRNFNNTTLWLSTPVTATATRTRKDSLLTRALSPASPRPAGIVLFLVRPAAPRSAEFCAFLVSRDA